jgi:hypothetical protein
MLRRLVAPLREFGIVAGTLYAIDRLLQRLSPRMGLRCYELVRQPTQSSSPVPERLLRNVSVQEIGRAHPDVARMPIPLAVAMSRFDQGARCLGAYRKGALIGYLWFRFGAYDEDEVRCTYDLADAPASVWDFDVYVFPEHRMGVGFLALWHGAFAFLRNMGVEQSFSRITLFNLVSRRAHARLGAVTIGHAVFVRVFDLEFALATLPAYVGLSVSGGRPFRMRFGRNASAQRADKAGAAGNDPVR